MWLAGGVDRDRRGVRVGMVVVLIVRDKSEDDDAAVGVKGIAEGLR